MEVRHGGSEMAHWPNPATSATVGGIAPLAKATSKGSICRRLKRSMRVPDLS
ncbi:hypothetical protein [Mesorhizobium sp.]|uniref:hypothetical protein n=1 Tax=Mesorhizobium sp. TaxID=1871066 RepID=UPI0035618C45